MIQKVILGFVLCLFTIVTILSCSKNVNEQPVGNPPRLISSDPLHGSNEVEAGITELFLRFDVNVTLSASPKITLNGVLVSGTHPGVSGTLNISVSPLQPATDYTLLIPEQTVKGPTGLFNDSEIKVSFKTSTPNSPRKGLSPEAEKVLLYINNQRGKKALSGVMSNVSWNINEAEWVYHHTGKWPAINCFDYLHLQSSPSNWIDYSKTSVVENWWNDGGLVFAMWHWNVPNNSGDENGYSFYWGSKPNETQFDVSKIDDPASDEYKRMISDIDKISEYLKLLKSKNIPIVWRPLHEASGNIGLFQGGEAWFWWGAAGAESYKKLWRLMFNRMTEYHGLNNLIWVWTSQLVDDDWFPGDDYVHIVGRDLYNEMNTEEIVRQFNQLQKSYPEKSVALSECGSVATFSAQWRAGAKWSWFMPWYDYKRTLNPGDDLFQLEEHTHASVAWWRDAFDQPYVITRDELPNFK